MMIGKPAPARNMASFLTDEGRELAERIMGETYERMNAYFEGIPREEILTMRNTLIKVLNNMDSDIERYMKSKYENPYYTLLHTHPKEDEGLTEFITLKKKKKTSSKKT